MCDRKSVCPLGSNVVGKLWTAWNVRASISRLLCCVVMCSSVFLFSLSAVQCRFSFGYDHFTHIFMDNIMQCLPALFRIVCRIVVYGPPFKNWNWIEPMLLCWDTGRELRAALWFADHMLGWKLKYSMHCMLLAYFYVYVIFISYWKGDGSR